MTAPELTMPPAEASWIRDAYHAAETILEYGSGGSTCLAADMPGKTIFAVESDPEWAESLAAYFAAHPPTSPVHLHQVDIGPTGPWGYPRDDSQWSRFHHYPLSVWDRADFQHPDVVLVDGRFRVACLLTVLFRASRPTAVYFDDYGDRPSYHVVERLVTPQETRGRMARFDLEPTAVPAAELSWLMDAFTRTQ